VQTEIDPQRARYFFPIRRVRDTAFLSFEEIMRLNEGSRRSMYLKLHQILASGQAPLNRAFQLRSTIIGPQPLSEGSSHGTIVEVTPDLVVLDIDELQETRGATARTRLSVPLELVAAVWKDRGLVSIALMTAILWDSRKWVFGAQGG
jgi:hypothetical protein